ncbi:MAG: virulence-associated E family protein [Prevotella sp.]|nr:virulence-associated E family protein [Prevotella sp.]
MRKPKKKQQKTAKKAVGNSNTGTVNALTASPMQKVITALKAEYDFRHNLGNQKMEFRPLTETRYSDFSEIDFNSIRVKLGLKNTPCSKENFKTIIFSDIWTQYDPYKEFLSGLPKWNGHDYIADLAATVKTDNDRYWGWCLRKWLVAFVGSLADEETVNQTAIIFCGGQGIGKSTWLRNILPPELRKYSSSGFLDPKDKETLVQLSELCLYNMDEVENLKPRNIEAIKELITKASMYLRRAYTTLSQNYVRRCSFCGTANGINILHDITGNRRFLCQNVLNIDYKLEGFNLPQLYAQALQLYQTGFQYWLDINEQKAVEKQNARFRATSIEEELIDTYYVPCKADEKGAKRMQAHEILSTLQGKANCGRLSPVTIGKILSSKGFISKKSGGISKWIVKDRVLTNDGND